MRFVIVVDAQADFMAAAGALSVRGADALIGPMQAWLDALRPDAVAGVLFTYDTHEREIYAGSREAEAFPIHCERGTPGWQSVLDPARVDPAIPRYRLEKGVFDMWEEPDVRIKDEAGDLTPRETFFADLKARGIDTVEVVGVAADYCVRWAIDGLLERGFRVTVPAGLTRGIEREIGQVAREEFAGRPLVVA